MFFIVAKSPTLYAGREYRPGDCLKECGRVKRWKAEDSARRFFRAHVAAPGERTGWIVTDLPEIYR